MACSSKKVSSLLLELINTVWDSTAFGKNLATPREKALKGFLLPGNGCVQSLLAEFYK